MTDEQPAPTRPRVVLVGPPGAGKSSVAEVLARRWAVDVRDTDADIESQQGKAIPDIFIDEGEPAFRGYERAAVAGALRDHAGVLALGGGAVLAESTRELLAEHQVVFLDVGLAQAASRVGFGVTRPLLLGNVRGQLKALLDERRPLYAAVATATVRTDELTVEQVADEVERLVP